mmetsp:Transcript_1166/g.4925  ORF Transcript_1166/g.4925 Transcript_1166/m.4925 type:complete len:411 (+) Transcript_1166:2691-3923(+)
MLEADLLPLRECRSRGSEDHLFEVGPVLSIGLERPEPDLEATVLVRFVAVLQPLPKLAPYHCVGWICNDAATCIALGVKEVGQRSLKSPQVEVKLVGLRIKGVVEEEGASQAGPPPHAESLATLSVVVRDEEEVVHGTLGQKPPAPEDGKGSSPRVRAAGISGTAQGTAPAGSAVVEVLFVGLVLDHDDTVVFFVATGLRSTDVVFERLRTMLSRPRLGRSVKRVVMQNPVGSNSLREAVLPCMLWVLEPPGILELEAKVEMVAQASRPRQGLDILVEVPKLHLLRGTVPFESVDRLQASKRILPAGSSLPQSLAARKGSLLGVEVVVEDPGQVVCHAHAGVCQQLQHVPPLQGDNDCRVRGARSLPLSDFFSNPDTALQGSSQGALAPRELVLLCPVLGLRMALHLRGV